jgi:hypothetical protein
MSWRQIVFVICCCTAMCRGAKIDRSGLIAQWNFDEPSATIIKDASGNGHDARLVGASIVPQGKGHALSLDGRDDFVDCGKLPIHGPITIELWIKPTRKAHGMSVIAGEGLSSFLLTYYNTEVADFFIGGGGNNSRGKLKLNAWNHVVASFDGNHISQWVNGRQTYHLESKYKVYITTGQFVIGTNGQPSLPRFKGLIDRVRIYNRPLTSEEATARFRAESVEYDFDPIAFTRVRTDLYEYLDNKDPYVVVKADYTELLPLQGNARLEATLVSRDKPDVILQQNISDPAPARERYGGVVEASLSCAGLAKGEYVVRVQLQDAHGSFPVEEQPFSYPPKPRNVPEPAARVASAMPADPAPTRFGFVMKKGGGFELTQNGVKYPFETRVSWPKGDFNRLVAADHTWQKGEEGWRVRVSAPGKGRWVVDATGSGFYKLRRQVQLFPSHVSIKDTYTNLTDQDLGLLVYNDTPVKAENITGSLLSGNDRWGRQVELTYPDYAPSTFFTDAKGGIGIMPLDDVFIVQAVPYVAWQDAAGVGTEKFALPPRAAYTLEWAVFPTASKDYYDFINTVRKTENRISTMQGAPGYLTNTLLVPERRQVPESDYVAKRNLKIGLIHNLAYAADDPELSIEGIEFTDFPLEMQLVKEQRDTIRQLHPGLKAIFHIAHSLYCTNKPDRFADSKVIGSDGNQASWGDGSAFGEKHKAAGWRWWIFYPTPGNSFHDAMMKSIDVMMDDIGMDGGFMDGFMAGYSGHWSYDTNVRWDGHSAEIDTNTKTISRKMNSVILLSQPSMLEYAHKIRDKGGVVIAMHNVMTRTLGQEKEIIFAHESASGPDLHLAPNSSVLGANQGFNSEHAIYLDILDKLRWGMLYLHYLDGRPLTHETLASKQYPITCEEIRAGMVRGPERIVTMNSGTYGWNGSHDLHFVHKFDGRGAPAAHDFLTTVDSGRVRTEIAFAKDESAVIEPLPATLESNSPVNVRVDQFDDRRIRILLNGNGDVTLRIRSGAFALAADTTYQVKIGETMTSLIVENGELAVPLKLNGLTVLAVEPASNQP